MNKAGSTLYRRRILRYAALGSVAGLAGCLGDDDTTEDAEPSGTDGSQGDEELSELFDLAGDGSEKFEDWLAPEATHPPGEDAETLFAYQDFEIAEENDVEHIRNYREHQAQLFGTDTGSLEGEIIIGYPGEELELSNIHLGEFDADSIVSALEAEGGTITEEYEGYTVFEDRIAIGEDAIIETPEYDSFIDAKTGTGTHLRDEYDGVGQVLDLQPAGIQISASHRENITDLTVSASSFVSVDQDGSPDRIVRTFVFESAGDASVERAEEIAAEGSYEETVSGEHHGRVVMLEYRV